MSHHQFVTHTPAFIEKRIESLQENERSGRRRMNIHEYREKYKQEFAEIFEGDEDKMVEYRASLDESREEKLAKGRNNRELAEKMQKEKERLRKKRKKEKAKALAKAKESGAKPTTTDDAGSQSDDSDSKDKTSKASKKQKTAANSTTDKEEEDSDKFRLSKIVDEDSSDSEGAVADDWAEGWDVGDFKQAAARSAAAAASGAVAAAPALPRPEMISLGPGEGSVIALFQPPVFDEKTAVHAAIARNAETVCARFDTTTLAQWGNSGLTRRSLNAWLSTGAELASLPPDLLLSLEYAVDSSVKPSPPSLPPAAADSVANLATLAASRALALASTHAHTHAQRPLLSLPGASGVAAAAAGTSGSTSGRASRFDVGPGAAAHLAPAVFLNPHQQPLLQQHFHTTAFPVGFGSQPAPLTAAAVAAANAAVLARLSAFNAQAAATSSAAASSAPLIPIVSPPVAAQPAAMPAAVAMNPAVAAALAKVQAALQQRK